MTTELSLEETQKLWHASVKGYIIGFTASLALTAFSFLSVITKLLPSRLLIPTVICLALSQALFQLHFFLHVGKEAKPKWETAVFICMIPVVLIIVLGTLWIMFDLNERMMPEGMSH